MLSQMSDPKVFGLDKVSKWSLVRNNGQHSDIISNTVYTCTYVGVFKCMCIRETVQVSS